MRNVTLVLQDGTKFHGKSFGYDAPVAGEVVFNTAMMGYPESLTDPSYAGQLVTLTFPLVGNYGVPPFTFGAEGLPTFMESDHIHASAIIVSDYSEQYCHWNANESLAEWLKREQVPGITGIDTRELTKVLREHGVMMGQIIFDDDPTNIPQAQYEGVNFVDRVSCKEIIRYNEGAGKRVVLVDCGVKANIIRNLIERGLEVVRVPWNYDYTGMEFDGLFLGNGPGDPEPLTEVIAQVKQMIAEDLPMFGICLGHQIIALANGIPTYKMHNGHRGINHPVKNLLTGKDEITSQNHGFAVSRAEAEANPNIEITHTHLNDDTVMGLRIKGKKCFSVQYHPEAAPGPNDATYLFDQFVKILSH